MSYSSLVTHVCPSPNCTPQRTHAVDTITVHHVAGKTKDGCAVHCSRM